MAAVSAAEHAMSDTVPQTASRNPLFTIAKPLCVALLSSLQAGEAPPHQPVERLVREIQHAIEAVASIDAAAVSPCADFLLVPLLLLLPAGITWPAPSAALVVWQRAFMKAESALSAVSLLVNMCDSSVFVPRVFSAVAADRAARVLTAAEGIVRLASVSPMSSAPISVADESLQHACRIVIAIFQARTRAGSSDGPLRQQCLTQHGAFVCSLLASLTAILDSFTAGSLETARPVASGDPQNVRGRCAVKAVLSTLDAVILSTHALPPPSDSRSSTKCTAPLIVTVLPGIFSSLARFLMKCVSFQVTPAEPIQFLWYGRGGVAPQAILVLSTVLRLSYFSVCESCEYCPLLSAPEMHCLRKAQLTLAAQHITAVLCPFLGNLSDAVFFALTSSARVTSDSACTATDVDLCDQSVGGAQCLASAADALGFSERCGSFSNIHSIGHAAIFLCDSVMSGTTSFAFLPALAHACMSFLARLRLISHVPHNCARLRDDTSYSCTLCASLPALRYACIQCHADNAFDSCCGAIKPELSCSVLLQNSRNCWRQMFDSLSHEPQVSTGVRDSWPLVSLIANLVSAYSLRVVGSGGTNSAGLLLVSFFSTAFNDDSDIRAQDNAGIPSASAVAVATDSLIKLLCQQLLPASRVISRPASAVFADDAEGIFALALCRMYQHALVNCVNQTVSHRASSRKLLLLPIARVLSMGCAAGLFSLSPSTGGAGTARSELLHAANVLQQLNAVCGECDAAVDPSLSVLLQCPVISSVADAALQATILASHNGESCAAVSLFVMEYLRGLESDRCALVSTVDDTVAQVIRVVLDSATNIVCDWFCKPISSALTEVVDCATALADATSVTRLPGMPCREGADFAWESLVVASEKVSRCTRSERDTVQQLVLPARALCIPVSPVDFLRFRSTTVSDSDWNVASVHCSSASGACIAASITQAADSSYDNTDFAKKFSVGLRFIQHAIIYGVASHPNPDIEVAGQLALLHMCAAFLDSSSCSSVFRRRTSVTIVPILVDTLLLHRHALRSSVCLSVLQQQLSLRVASLLQLYNTGAVPTTSSRLSVLKLQSGAFLSIDAALQLVGLRKGTATMLSYSSPTVAPGEVLRSCRDLTLASESLLVGSDLFCLSAAPLMASCTVLSSALLESLCSLGDECDRIAQRDSESTHEGSREVLSVSAGTGYSLDTYGATGDSVAHALFAWGLLPSALRDSSGTSVADKDPSELLQLEPLLIGAEIVASFPNAHAVGVSLIPGKTSVAAIVSHVPSKALRSATLTVLYCACVCLQRVNSWLPAVSSEVCSDTGNAAERNTAHVLPIQPSVKLEHGLERIRSIEMLRAGNAQVGTLTLCGNHAHILGRLARLRLVARIPSLKTSEALPAAVVCSNAISQRAMSFKLVPTPLIAHLLRLGKLACRHISPSASVTNMRAAEAASTVLIYVCSMLAIRPSVLHPFVASSAWPAIQLLLPNTSTVSGWAVDESLGGASTLCLSVPAPPFETGSATQPEVRHALQFMRTGTRNETLATDIALDADGANARGPLSLCNWIQRCRVAFLLVSVLCVVPTSFSDSSQASFGAACGDFLRSRLDSDVWPVVLSVLQFLIASFSDAPRRASGSGAYQLLSCTCRLISVLAVPTVVLPRDDDEQVLFSQGSSTDETTTGPVIPPLPPVMPLQFKVDGDSATARESRVYDQHARLLQRATVSQPLLRCPQALAAASTLHIILSLLPLSRQCQEARDAVSRSLQIIRHSFPL